ncbi:TIGR03086 family metal-binding protein [Kitasatospora sp. NPDC086791]|uniref:TIGR03086 family metal-binding protein n=1 Tax=Kitasatospora sp. NPDC086791 TaxID=3155178 RepID=UPI0034419099
MSAAARPGIVELHARSLELAAEVVDAVRPERLDLPTPCAGWTLRRLLAHVVGQQQGFAAAARGAGPDLALWADAPIGEGLPGEDPAGAFRRTAVELTAAFREAAAADRRVWLPELLTTAPIPLDRAVGFHLLDTLVHAWDVAAALGTGAGVGAAVEREEALIAALVAVAEAVPDTPEARAPGRAFGPGLPPGEGEAAGVGAGRFERVLAMLGRDPAWPGPGSGPGQG